MFKPSHLPLLITIVAIAAGIGFFSFTKQPTEVESEAASPALPAASEPVWSGFSMAQVATHDNIDDCYIVIESKVYDVTGFIDQHPGGVDKITSGCGKEMTGIFAKIHSNKAWDLLKKFQVGVLSE